MKSVLIALCLVVAVFCLADGNPVEDEWSSYKAKYRKTYETVAEDKLRFTIYLENKKLVAEHNRQYSQGKKTFTLGVNKFSDLLPEEFAVYRGMKGSQKVEEDVPIHQVNSQAVPDAVDWRPLGYVTPVKDQGQCGSCWAFSSTGSLEGQHFKATGDLVSLSEQQLVDCNKPENSGCHGGLMTMAFGYIENNNGIDTEESYPYVAAGQFCAFNPDTIGATCTGYITVTSEDEAALQDAVANVGPIAVAMDASHINFQFYKEGIYHNDKCSSTDLDHAVLVVGYGSDVIGDYWIVKNSWGTDWGMAGYFNIARNAGNMCGIATAALYPTV